MVVVLILWTVLANVVGDGNPAPLPYVPILNPLDLAQAMVFVALGTWIVHMRRDAPEVLSVIPPNVIPVIFVALAFYWINLMVLRTVHFWFDAQRNCPSVQYDHPSPLCVRPVETSRK